MTKHVRTFNPIKKKAVGRSALSKSIARAKAKPKGGVASSPKRAPPSGVRKRLRGRSSQRLK